MTDKMTPQQRSYCMSRIRSGDTKPEMIVRHYLWHHGYRYRVHYRRLPGTPDIVLPKLKTVIFINGCFWHGHTCQDRKPLTNADFWARKIQRNQQRDIDNGIRLRNMGWNVITIWECELRKVQRDDTLQRLHNTLKSFKQVPQQAAPRPSVYRYTYPGEEYNPAVAEPGEDYNSTVSGLGETDCNTAERKPGGYNMPEE